MSFPQFLIALPAFPPLCCPSFLPSSSLFPSPCATAIYRRPSISPACQRAFSFGLLLQGARRWQITTRQPVIFDLSEPPPPPPHTHTPCLLPFLYPTSASILTTLTSVSPDNTAIPHHTAAVRTSTLPSCLPPSISSTSISAENLAPETKKKKKWGKKEILWQWKYLSWRGSSSCIITWASVTGDDPGEWRISIACHSRHSADCIDKACQGL